MGITGSVVPFPAGREIIFFLAMLGSRNSLPVGTECTTSRGQRSLKFIVYVHIELGSRKRGSVRSLPVCLQGMVLHWRETFKFT